ncbi:MAG TPA: protein kinase, partial [Roseiflexaceae bacterium]
MTRATPTSLPILHDRYRIEEQLGAGRLAVVYRAYDERLQRRVLVHMLRKELVGQEPLYQRFLREAHDGARRSHPSLLEVYDSGEVAGRPYMVTEYVAGRTLRELGTLSLEEALLYSRQVVGAVAVCQMAGVPHPPINSNNIILVEDGHVELVESWLTPPAD